MEDTAHTPATDARSLETIATLLSDARRRHVLEVLAERDSRILLRDLAAAVASREGETQPDDDSPATTHEIAAGLHHVHLPKLDRAGVVDYDARANVVVPERAASLTRHASVIEAER